MSRKDTFHEIVVSALVREGWTITHDPYVLLFGIHDLQIDLGAEMPIGAEREGRKIAVEIKSFLSISTFGDLYHAIGQFQFYHSLLKRREAERVLYLALPEDAYHTVFDVEEGNAFRRESEIKLIVYGRETEEIIEWIE